MWVLFCFEKPFEIIVDSRSVSRMPTERSWVPLPRVSWWWHLVNCGVVLPPPRPQDSDSHMVQMQHVFITEGPLGLPFMDTHTLLHLGPDSPTLPSPSAILSFPSRSRSSVTTVYVTFPQCRSLEICLSWCVCPKSVPLHCWVVFMWGGLFNLWAIKGHPGSPSAGPVWTKLLGTSRNRFLFSFF